MSIHEMTVDLGARSYPIRIGTGVIEAAGQELRAVPGAGKLAIITDENVGPLYLDTLLRSVERAGWRASALTLPAGEGTKSWANLQRSVEWLIEQKIERQDIVIALGGGVIGDLTGFSAAILRRGVRFVQIPTSLLAQVDSSVGGKTGINSPQGKNLVGAFYQPSLVLADIAALETLPQRDFIAGYGEVVKYGLLGNAEFFAWLEENGPGLAGGARDLRASAIRTSCEMKAAIVARDETEQGDRALLNLGHTFGHALEAATQYSDRLLHGEGVAVGTVLAFELSQRLGLCAQECPSRVRAHFRAMSMKTDLSDIAGDLPDADGLIALMAQDKKVKDGKPRFILARGIGQAFVTEDVDPAAVKNVLAEGLSRRV